MTDEQAGCFIKIIYNYIVTGDIPELDFAMSMAVMPIINQIERDAEAKKEISKKRAEAGKLGGEKTAKQKVAKVANGSNCLICLNDTPEAENLSEIIKETFDMQREEKSMTEKKPRKSRKKPESEFTIGYKMRLVFEEDYRSKFQTSYYFEKRDFPALKNLRDKLSFKLRAANLTDTDEDILENFKTFLAKINNTWVLEHFTPCIINSKFNELVAQIKTNSNGNGKQKGCSDEELARIIKEGFASEEGISGDNSDTGEPEQ